MDLGSDKWRAYNPDDLRSVRNENSGLPGLRRYLGQAAAYRMAWQLEPELLGGIYEKNGRHPEHQYGACRHAKAVS